MVNKLQDFVEFRTDYKSGNAAPLAIHLQSTNICKQIFGIKIT